MTQSFVFVFHRKKAFDAQAHKLSTVYFRASTGNQKLLKINKHHNTGANERERKMEKGNEPKRKCHVKKYFFGTHKPTYCHLCFFHLKLDASQLVID